MGEFFWAGVHLGAGIIGFAAIIVATLGVLWCILVGCIWLGDRIKR